MKERGLRKAGGILSVAKQAYGVLLANATAPAAVRAV